jgi:hypothetical protein
MSTQTAVPLSPEEKLKVREMGFSVKDIDRAYQRLIQSK